MYSNCKLYKLNSKKYLTYLLQIDDNNFFEQRYVSLLITPIIQTEPKERLIEYCNFELKMIQKKIKNYLSDINFEDYIFSGVKGKSYVDNANAHTGVKYLYKTDISGFFPSISRNHVYNFFRNELKTAPDIAEILTNLTTINIDFANQENIEEVNIFLQKKHINCRNHLITGAPTSVLLSYLSNIGMFDKIKKIADKKGVKFTLYVDDLFFSSDKPLGRKFQEDVKKIITEYNYQISEQKCKFHMSRYPKRITGVIINKNGDLVIPNNLRLKIKMTLINLKKDPEDYKLKRRLEGLVYAARQIEPDAYPSILQLIKDQ